MIAYLVPSHLFFSPLFLINRSVALVQRNPAVEAVTQVRSGSWWPEDFISRTTLPLSYDYFV